MTFTAADFNYMARALNLAQRGRYTCMPNPKVGCVLVKDGVIVGEGWHKKAGEAHAEVEAINSAREAGVDTVGCIAYVTLEPCCYTGRTGPCTEQLITAGVTKVFYGTLDPNPKVSGQGLQKLLAANIDVVGPLLEAEAVELNPGFIKRMQKMQPLVRLKMAMSLDGRTAMASGESKWITGNAARRDVQKMRVQSCAIVTGVETVLKDDAALTVRAEELDIENAQKIAERQPLRVVLDSKARLPQSQNIFSANGPVLWVIAEEAKIPGALPDHVECIQLPCSDKGISLPHLLSELASRECNEILVEAGATLAGQFVQQGLVDEIFIYMAPTLLGSEARPLVDLPLQGMSEKLSLTVKDIRQVGNDWRITAKPGLETSRD